MSKLSVNLNKIALLRNARTLGVPDLIEAARISLRAGAHGITVHPRPDQRHIRFADLPSLASFLRSEFPKAELNLEGNPFIKEGHYMELAKEICPTQCTLVPDAPEQNTSDHGWNIVKDEEHLKGVIGVLKEKGCRVSLFMDPVAEELEKLAGLGADRVELYTESYARSYSDGSKKNAVLAQYKNAAQLVQKLHMGLNAGHGLNRQNLGYLLQVLPNVLEVSIGHALIADAVFMGLEQSVKAYLLCFPKK